MESHKIEKLLEKYFAGNTTLSEETTLRNYFTSNEVAPHLEDYSTLFKYLVEAKEVHSERTVKLPSQKKLRTAWASVAAVIVLAFGIYFGQSYQEQRQAELAFEETKKALSLLAQNLERGNKKIIYLHEFEETTQKMYRNN